MATDAGGAFGGITEEAELEFDFWVACLAVDYHARDSKLIEEAD